MKPLFARFKLFAVLFILWLLMNGNMKVITIGIGLVVSFFVTYFSYDSLLDRKGKHFKSIPFTKLIFYFVTLFLEIFKAAFHFSLNVFKKEYVPIVFKMSLEHLDPLRVAIVANSITLTPGTISIEMIDQSIYVMVLAKPGTPVEVLEKPIREKFEKLLNTEGT
jgi:multicomponent Na+:H+ antiporter subunit E